MCAKIDHIIFKGGLCSKHFPFAFGVNQRIALSIIIQWCDSFSSMKVFTSIIIYPFFHMICHRFA